MRKRNNPDLFSHDTIAAIATPLGQGGIGVVRISGRKCLSILKKIFRLKGRKAVKFSTHKMTYGSVVDPDSGVILDSGMAAFMRGPSSYTGEDVVEISLHGSIPILKNVLDLVVRLGARIADKGEFTKRAFLNGKIDLAQAEAVLDLIKSRTSFSASQATGQLEGALSKDVHSARNRLLEVLTSVEASIDFPEDIDASGYKNINKSVAKTQQKIKDLLETSDVGRVVREGALVAIIGRPNVGKSSLLNALLREERAIVTSDPGTTRDTLEEGINVLGIPVRIVDTAGLRKAKGEAEAKGIDRTHRSINEADLILLVMDSSAPITRQDNELIIKHSGKNIILVFNKIDKKAKADVAKIVRLAPNAKRARISATNGTGIRKLEETMYKALLGGFSSDIGKVLINSRHKQCLVRAGEELNAATVALAKKDPIDLVSINLKEAVMALGEVTGEVVTEEILSKIFSEFCVGK